MFIAYGNKLGGFDKILVRAEVGEGQPDLITGETPDVEFSLI